MGQEPRARAWRTADATITGMNLRVASVLVCGDTHGDAEWLSRIVLPSARERGVDAVLVVGDFGFYREAATFLRRANLSRRAFGVDVLFLDGNHEEFPYLNQEIALCRAAGDDDRSPVQLGESLYYLPRGSRIEIGGAQAAILGGATSINRYDLDEGETWFADEAITEEDLDALGTDRADILLSHDAPSGWAIKAREDSELPETWRRQLPASREHRVTLRRGYEQVRPRLLIHGHFHVGYEHTSQEEWGAVTVVGLQKNRYSRWGRVLTSVDGVPVLGPFIDSTGQDCV